jgi:hypothetical protein
VRHPRPVWGARLDSCEASRGRVLSATNGEKERGRGMGKIIAGILGAALVMSLSPTANGAQSVCPVEVAQAKRLLSKKQAMAKAQGDASRALAGARQGGTTAAPRENQDVQAPRENQNVQAPRENQDVQAPRENQNVQAPRENQNVQAPRENQNVQAPRENQNVQAPRKSQDAQAPRMTRAASLIREAEGACKSGNPTLASENAKSALELLK